MRQSVCVVVLSALAVISLAAQSAPAVGILIRQSYGDAVQHDGQRTDGYRLYVRDKGLDTKVGRDIPLAGLEVEAATVPVTLPRANGEYAIVVGAYGPGGEAKTAIPVRVFGAATPVDLRVYVTATRQKGGGVRFALVDARPVAAD